MVATLRRALRVMLLVSTLIAITSAVGVAGASASARPLAASNTPGVPTSLIKSIGNTTATYCVENYEPGTTVSVVNQLNQATGSITTDSTGAGCTTIVVQQACATDTSQTIVANGLDATGKPATSQAIADAPANPALCTSSSPTSTPTDSGSCSTSNEASINVTVAGTVITLKGSACDFLAGETVDGFAHSNPVYIGTTTARADGVAVIRAQVPVCLTAGNHELELIGETSGNVATAPFSVSVTHSCQAGGEGGVTSAGGGQGGATSAGGGTIGANSGSLAFTGADIFAMVLAALVLLVIGTIVLLSVRRRRTAAPAA
jgi:hypothetical protein